MSTPTSHTAPRKPRWPWYVGGTVLGLVIIGSCSANAPSTDSGLTPAQQADMKAAGDKFAAGLPSRTFAPIAPPAPEGPVTSIGEGTFEVSTGSGQVPPGTYRTAGPSSTNFMGCYWERSQDTSGNFGAMIANDIGKGPTTVTISSTDGAFKTQGCATWTRVR